MRMRRLFPLTLSLLLVFAVAITACGGPTPGGPGGGSVGAPGGQEGSAPGDQEGSAPGGQEGSAPGDEQADSGGDAGMGSKVWQPIEGTPPEEIADWVEEHRDQLGIFQEVGADRTYVLISWGEKPTGGYSVQVKDATIEGDDRLVLHVTLQEPGANDMVTQALSYPYALIAVTPARVYRLEPHFEGATFFANAAFEITAPEAFAEVDDEVRIAGRARVWEGHFMVALEDGHNVLFEEPVTVEKGAPEWAEFDLTVPLREKPTSPNGVLSVFEKSAQDGTPVNVLYIPVAFRKWQ